MDKLITLGNLTTFKTQYDNWISTNMAKLSSGSTTSNLWGGGTVSLKTINSTSLIGTDNLTLAPAFDPLYAYFRMSDIYNGLLVSATYIRIGYKMGLLRIYGRLSGPSTTTYMLGWLDSYETSLGFSAGFFNRNKLYDAINAPSWDYGARSYWQYDTGTEGQSHYCLKMGRYYTSSGSYGGYGTNTNLSFSVVFVMHEA